MDYDKLWKKGGLVRMSNGAPVVAGRVFIVDASFIFREAEREACQPLDLCKVRARVICLKHQQQPTKIN